MDPAQSTAETIKIIISQRSVASIAESEQNFSIASGLVINVVNVERDARGVLELLSS